MTAYTRPVVNGAQGVQLIDYLRAIRRRWPVVLIVTFLVLATALVVSLSGQKKYEASADLLFNSNQRVETLIAGDSGSDIDPERQLNTDVQLIKLDTVASQVRRTLRLDTGIVDLLEAVETETSSTSDIVAVVATDPDPKTAAAIANAFATEYVAYRRRSARQALVQAAELAQSRLDALAPADRQTEQARQLEARKRELEITAALQTGGVEIVRRARVPESPSSPRPKLSAALGIFLGLVLGAVIALVLEFADRRMKDESTVEEVLALPVLASIPPPPRRGVDDHLQREAYGLLAANVRLASTGDSNVVMITSPSPGDGKTSVSLGMARALARLGARVILIEADMRRPSVARYTGLPQQGGGLSALLLNGERHLAHEIIWLDASTMRPVTLDALKDGLSFAILTAGSAPPNPQRLLARPEMAAVVETARSLADVVIIDTPPIGTVNDSATLGRLVDSVIVVARLNQTTKDAARRALRQLRNITAEVTGVVVTDAPAVDQYAYYGVESSSPEESDSAVEGAHR
jgi:capsular exopolysaccharide synthesis family protein